MYSIDGGQDRRWLGKREKIVVAQSQTVSEAERGNVIAVANLLVSSLGFSAENLSRGEWESGVSPCQDEVLPIFYLRHVGERERESWPLMSRFQGTGKNRVVDGTERAIGEYSVREPTSLLL